MEDNLKPCPFCGGKASARIVVESHGMDGSYKDVRFYCSKCSASMQFPADEFFGRKAMTKEEMVKVWNRRVDDEEA